MKHVLVSVIIVNWNGVKWLEDCFHSLKNQTYANVEIIVVDNASTDQSVAWIKKHAPYVNVIVNKKNEGFAQGNNIGYKHAKGTYIVFLNNDTRVTPSFITELVDVMDKDNSIGGVQSKILLMDDPHRLDSIGAFLTVTGFLYHNAFGQLDKKEFDLPINLYTAKGACMMFRAETLGKVEVGGNIFDPDYFAYFEETDLCHRVWLAGYRIVYAPRSIIYHKMGATSGSMNAAYIQYHSFKNRIRSYLKNFGLLWLFTIFFVHVLVCQFFAFLSLIQGRWSLFRAVEKACWWNIKEFSSTLSMRRYIQKKIRRVSDKDFAPFVLKILPFRYYTNLILSIVRSS